MLNYLVTTFLLLTTSIHSSNDFITPTPPEPNQYLNMSNSINDTQDIDILITLANQWTLAADGCWIALIEIADSWNASLSITDTQLATYHEKLPQAMRAILEFRKKHQNPLVAYKDEICDTVSLLRGELLTVVSNHRKTVLKTIDKLQFVESAPDEVILLGTSCSTWKCQSLSEPIQIVTNSGFNSISIKSDELDAQLPGWRNRLETGQALGLEEAQLYHYVFFENRPNLVQADLSHISFD